MSKEEERGKRGRKVEQLRGRERANSTSILEFVQGKKEDKEAVKNKRKREEIKKQAEESFKRHNIMMRTPSGVKRAEEKEGETEKKEEKVEWEGALVMMLRELKEEMVGMRKEMREIKENWKIREERLERKIDNLEERIKMLERQEEEKKEKWEERIEEITKKVIILLEERKGEEQQGTTRQKSGVYE